MPSLPPTPPPTILSVCHHVVPLLRLCSSHCPCPAPPPPLLILPASSGTPVITITGPPVLYFTPAAGLRVTAELDPSSLCPYTQVSVTWTSDSTPALTIPPAFAGFVDLAIPGAQLVVTPGVAYTLRVTAQVGGSSGAASSDTVVVMCVLRGLWGGRGVWGGQEGEWGGRRGLGLVVGSDMLRVT